MPDFEPDPEPVTSVARVPPPPPPPPIPDPFALYRQLAGQLKDALGKLEAIESDVGKTRRESEKAVRVLTTALSETSNLRMQANSATLDGLPAC
jgi:hypothetical protein